MPNPVFALREEPAAEKRPAVLAGLEGALRAGAEEGLIREFGSTGLRFHVMGAGGIWLGRPWTPGKAASYVYPDEPEINAYLDEVFARLGQGGGPVMIDTAASYGFTEKRLGQYFDLHPAQFKQAFIATKWGEQQSYDGTKTIKDQWTFQPDYSLRNLQQSVARSQNYLKKIDLLYLHMVGGATADILRNAGVMDEMARMKREHVAGIRFLGASISDPKVLQEAVEQKLLVPFDVIQMPGSVFLDRPDLVQALKADGKAIVLNSVIRKGQRDLSEQESHVRLLDNPDVSMILLGSRNHYRENIGYAEEWARAKSAAGAEETAYAQAYRQAVERIRAAIAKEGIQTSLTPGEIWTLSHMAGPDGSVVVIPRDQRIQALIPPDEIGLDRTRTADRYQVITSIPLLRVAREWGQQKGRSRPLALLASASLLKSPAFRLLRDGKIPRALELMGLTSEGASLVRETPVLAQGEDPDLPRWKPAQSSLSPWEAVERGAVGYKAGVMLGVELPGREYDPSWEKLAEANMEWVKDQARLIRQQTGGSGLGLMAAAILYAAPPKTYVPRADDVAKGVWEPFLLELERQGHTPDALKEELQKPEPAEWAREAQAKVWLRSHSKAEEEAAKAFALAHRQMTYRLAEAWGKTPGITLIMASGPLFADNTDQWKHRKEEADRSMIRLSQIPGVRGKWILPSRNKAPSVYKAEIDAMEMRGLLSGISPGRTLTQAALQQVGGGKKELLHTRHPEFPGALRASGRNLRQVLNRLDLQPASVWQTYGITREQAVALIAAAADGVRVGDLLIPWFGLLMNGYASSVNGAMAPAELLSALDPGRDRILVPEALLPAGIVVHIQEGVPIREEVIDALRRRGIRMEVFSPDRVPASVPDVQNIYLLKVAEGDERKWVPDRSALVVNFSASDPELGIRSSGQLAGLINVARRADDRVLRIDGLYRSERDIFALDVGA